MRPFSSKDRGSPRNRLSKIGGANGSLIPSMRQGPERPPTLPCETSKQIEELLALASFLIVQSWPGRLDASTLADMNEAAAAADASACG